MKKKHIPMRRCIGCNTSFPKEQLIRIASKDNQIIADLDGRTEGRGVYVCKNEACLKKIVKKKGFFRFFGMDITEEQKDILLGEMNNAKED